MRARAIAAAVVVALAGSACGGGSNGIQPTSTPQVQAVVASSVRIVGVGDSLTAGEQSGAIFGLKGGLPNPQAPGSYFPLLPTPKNFPIIPPTQGAGFWALLWSQLNNGADPLAVATSPLPLMNSPVGNIYVPTRITAPLGGTPTYAAAPCTGANALTYSPATASQARLNPGTTPLDLGIPGQTLHEALFQVSSLTSCAAQYSTTDPYAGLSAIVNAESGAIYPVLGTSFGAVSQVQAAVSLKPQIATVWLGSNDLLKPLASGGSYAFTDPTAFYNDMVSVIKQLQGAGAKVAVANLVDVLHASAFTSSTELTQLMTQLGVPAQVQPYYLSLVPAGGYLALSGYFKVLQSIQGLGPSGPPPVTLVAGDTIPAALASAVQEYNDTYNAQIAAAAHATGATLVDIHALFATIYTNGGYPVSATPQCCSLIYGEGLTSLDGIHPSNTGYAIVANAFIAAMNAGFSMNIPQVNVSAVYATDPYANHP
jgi:lysophospholipase L1-like esterase